MHRMKICWECMEPADGNSFTGNGGSHNQHQLPFDGNINWDTVMEKIACTGYRGATTLEPMNWDYSHLNICQFLELAYERAKRLDYLRK